jgi:hypothetical protein
MPLWSVRRFGNDDAAIRQIMLSEGGRLPATCLLFSFGMIELSIYFLFYWKAEASGQFDLAAFLISSVVGCAIWLALALPLQRAITADCRNHMRGILWQARLLRDILVLDEAQLYPRRVLTEIPYWGWLILDPDFDERVSLAFPVDTSTRSARVATLVRGFPHLCRQRGCTPVPPQWRLMPYLSKLPLLLAVIISIASGGLHQTLQGRIGSIANPQLMLALTLMFITFALDILISSLPRSVLMLEVGKALGSGEFEQAIPPDEQPFKRAVPRRLPPGEEADELDDTGWS